MTREPVLCECGEDVDFRADGLSVDDGNDPERGQVFCLTCFVALPASKPDSSAPRWHQ